MEVTASERSHPFYVHEKSATTQTQNSSPKPIPARASDYQRHIGLQSRVGNTQVPSGGATASDLAANTECGRMPLTPNPYPAFYYVFACSGGSISGQYVSIQTLDEFPLHANVMEINELFFIPKNAVLADRSTEHGAYEYAFENAPIYNWVYEEFFPSTLSELLCFEMTSYDTNDDLDGTLVNVADVWACQEVCVANADCHHFTYKLGACQLKGMNGADVRIRQSQAYRSGGRNCIHQV